MSTAQPERIESTMRVDTAGLRTPPHCGLCAGRIRKGERYIWTDGTRFYDHADTADCRSWVAPGQPS